MGKHNSGEELSDKIVNSFHGLAVIRGSWVFKVEKPRVRVTAFLSQS